MIRQTTNVLAKETALVVFAVLAYLAYKDVERVLKDTREPSAQYETHCDPAVGESQVCQLVRKIDWR